MIRHPVEEKVEQPVVDVEEQPAVVVIEQEQLMGQIDRHTVDEIVEQLGDSDSEVEETFEEIGENQEAMKKLAQQLNDLSSDPGTWNKSANKMLLKTFWSSKKNFDECRNIPKDFKSTRREFSDRNRYLSMSFFEEISNGETLIKDWLLYSTSKNLLVCAYCSLFSDPKNVSIFASGYGDWRNKQHIDNHPKSQEHISALSNFKNFQSANRVDKDIETKCQENQSYWMKVLLRIVETIKFLSERKLAFRGTEERIGSRNNGNYLGCLELIAKFDPFLKKHLDDHANKGHSHTSYLLKDICEEFIGILADKVAHVIVEEVKK